jgi:hypothetical protein
MDAIVGVSPVDPVARVFIMREVMELETDEICKKLTISSSVPTFFRGASPERADFPALNWSR